MPQPAPGVRIAPLVQRLLFALVVPVTAAFLLDRALGLSPWLTIGAVLLCIPLASLLVSKSALRDMDRLIAVVAPPEPAPPEPAPPESAPPESAPPESAPSAAPDGPQGAPTIHLT